MESTFIEFVMSHQSLSAFKSLIQSSCIQQSHNRLLQSNAQRHVLRRKMQNSGRALISPLDFLKHANQNGRGSPARIMTALAPNHSSTRRHRRRSAPLCPAFRKRRGFALLRHRPHPLNTPRHYDEPSRRQFPAPTIRVWHTL